MYLLKISYKSKPSSKLPIFWIAIYIVNKNWEIIQEWAELLEWTKFKWKEKYGEKFDKEVISFRKEITWSNINNFLLWTNDLKRINTLFKKYLTTFLNHDKYTTWSNPSWSDYDLRKTPYLIYWWKYNQLMFANFFKGLRVKNSMKVDLKLRNNNLEEISLEKYFSLFPLIEKIFLEKNKPLQLALNSENEDETLEIDTSDESNDYIKLILDEWYLKDEKLEKEVINDKRILILRRIFKNRMRKFEENDNIFWKLSESMCEAAHIFPVYKIKEKNISDWYMIADNNNWLNLPIQIHKMYDKGFIKFNKTWEVIYNNKEYEEQISEIFSIKNWLKIKSKNFHKKIKYIDMYNLSN